MVDVKEIKVEHTCCFLPIVYTHHIRFKNKTKAVEALINKGYKEEIKLNRQDYKNFDDYFISSPYGQKSISKYTRSKLTKDENDADVYLDYVAYIY